jgi:hypothetical protein
MLNDVVTLSSNNLATGRQYLVRIACDLNGWAWSVVEAAGNIHVAADTQRYGQRNGQFRKWAEIYTEYYNQSVSLELTLP